MHLLMTAEEIAADRPGWLKARQGTPGLGAFVGASDAGKLVGAKGAYGSAVGLWAQRTGQVPPDDDDELPDRVEFGTFCEPFTTWLLQREQPDWHITEGGLYARDAPGGAYPWATATFDRLRRDPDDGPYPAQLKNSAFNDWSVNGPPENYVAQVIWETFVARAPRGYLVAFDRNSVTIAILTVEMDERAEASLRVMIAAAERFRDCCATGTRPDVDGHPQTTAVLTAMNGPVDRDRSVVVPARLASRWLAACAAEARAKARRRLYLNHLLAAAGNARTWQVRAPGGELVTVATVSASPRAGHWVGPSKGDVTTVRPAAWDGWKQTR
jgi:hypothetical protein